MVSMHDAIQQAVQTFSYQDAATRDLAIFCATWLLYVLAVAWLVALVWRRMRITLGAVARFAIILALAFVASRILGHVVSDPRPYLLDRVTPLAPVSHDNGFPSDHALLAAALTATLWWIDRRIMSAFVVGTLLVMLGRLGIGAHHTLDVAGSAVIVAAAMLVALALPLPEKWGKRLLVLP